MARERDEQTRARLALENLLLRRSSRAVDFALRNSELEDEREFSAAKVVVAPLCVRVSVAAKMIGIGKTKMYELINDGEVKTLKMGSATMITVASLEALVRRQLDQSNPTANGSFSG